MATDSRMMIDLVRFVDRNGVAIMGDARWDEIPLLLPTVGEKLVTHKGDLYQVIEIAHDFSRGIAFIKCSEVHA